MKLTDLDPSWATDCNGRHGMGITFRCPVHELGCYQGVWFTNPVDGGPPVGGGHLLWQRTGDTFEALTLTPSIHVKWAQDGSTHWHGYVTNGEVT